MAWIYPFTRGPTRVRGGHTTWWHLIKWWQYWWTIISHTVLTTAVLGSVVGTAKAVVNQVDYKLGQLVTSLLGNRDCQDIEIDQLDPSDQPDQSDQLDEYSDDFTDSDYEIELERVQESSDEINEIIYQRDISANTVPKKIFMIGSSRVERLTRSYSAPQLSLVETNQGNEGNQDNKVTTPLDSNLTRSFSTSLISLTA